jgi:ubiquinone/menaquinone biosynthesis C-methylase UbiE
MSRLTDRKYLREEQYQNAANLKARIQLHRQYSTNPDPFPRWQFDQLDLPETCQILELGCGPGHWWSENRERIPANWRIILSDLSLGMVREAQTKLGTSETCFMFGVVDAQEIPFADGSFDAVMANHMLYHVPSRDEALSEIRRVLRPGGRLYAATNGKNHLRELREWEDRFFPHSVNEGWGSMEGNFGLETGEGQLRKWFADVRLKRHEDALLVTEVEPIIAYIRSLPKRGANEEAEKKLREFLTHELAASGAIRITKDSGIFVAIRESD